ncbi:hypothetical protein B0H67DRAFT_101053 [Lasiosphaeris hirsuta]|uniref:Uncharacterized protein n=1 Tax=Lasiosphaeris hirsuta TaxID=260670 RepID=A0AA40E511_9PEZI|nr:hypothetical protein B0H67DRAFT_101053 [Lasiosphaeris hirsuta]
MEARETNGGITELEGGSWVTFDKFESFSPLTPTGTRGSSAATDEQANSDRGGAAYTMTRMALVCSRHHVSRGDWAYRADSPHGSLQDLPCSYMAGIRPQRLNEATSARRVTTRRCPFRDGPAAVCISHTPWQRSGDGAGRLEACWRRWRHPRLRNDGRGRCCEPVSFLANFFFLSRRRRQNVISHRALGHGTTCKQAHSGPNQLRHPSAWHHGAGVLIRAIAQQ